MKKIIQKISAGLNELTLLQKARAHYEAGRYKEATDLFKELLKQSNDAEHKRCLADCYLQRAWAMADKGMHKEACVLWENYAAYGEAPLQAQDAYVLWLLAGKNNHKAYAVLEGFEARQLDEDYPELAAHLGALLLAGCTDMLAHLPKDSALPRHWEWVGEALDAYRNGERERCEQALKNLPFRSAFRDLRTLLKVQLLDAASLEQAPAMLAKIPEASPYRPLADSCLAYLQTGEDFIATMAGLEHLQRRVVAHAKGFSSKQMNLLETLLKQKNQLNDKMRFNLVLQYQEVFGTHAAQAYCQGALANYPAGYNDYRKHFALKDPFEESRLQALLCEQGKNSYDARFYWERCIDILKKNRPADDKKIALILRHMAELAHYDDAVELLADSLEYDADDRQSYLSLLSIYEQNRPDPVKYEEWLERSLKRFPADTDLLVRAAKSAASRKAFKKAVTYAKALLKVDPVNTLAKQLLFANHMAHARRLLKAEKFHLVEKEIQAAEQLSVDKSLRRQAELLRGFYLWQAEDKKQGLQQIAATLAKLNDDPVNMQFQVQMEAGLLELPTAALTRALPAFKDYLLSAPELQRLIAAMEYYDEQLDDRSLLFKALDKIKAPLKKSLQWLLDHETLLLSWCQALEKIAHFELLKHCAKMGNVRWRKPIWLYYQTVAECQGDSSRLDFMALFRLQNAFEDAHAENDHKTAVLIGRLIEQARGAMNPFQYEDDFDEFDEEAFGDDPIEDLFGHLPESVMGRIAKKTQDMMAKTDPDRFMAKCISQYGKRIDPQRLGILLVNPDFVGAIMVLVAAEDLKIDIGVSFEDIVERFEDDSPQFRLPFF